MREEDIRKREKFNRYLELVEKDARKIFADKQRFLEVACPACGGENLNPQFEKIGFNYVLCENCQTLFVNPRPGAEELNEFYINSESTSFWVEEFFKPVAEIRREKIFRPRAEFVRDKFSFSAPKIVGDIGAGFGIFLEELSKLWPSAKMTAIEPSSEMSEICRQKGLEVMPCTLEEVDCKNNQFDLLTAFELFEHLHNPGKFLEKIRALLRPGGHLLLTTQNGEGFDIKVLWEKSKSIAPPHHLNFFNPDSISFLLKSKGFVVEEVLTPGQLDWDIVEGMYQKEGVFPGRFWELVAKKASPEAKDKLQSWISENKLSSHMQILCQKPVL
ncbi:MAG: class I SAM-dependent methyltransferase [Candidatus Nealsonbacteria bacterium]